MNQIITEDAALEMYDDLLDCDGPVQIGTLSYNASYVLRKVDQIAYDCGFQDYLDALAQDGIYVEGFTDDQIEVEESEDE